MNIFKWNLDLISLLGGSTRPGRIEMKFSQKYFGSLKKHLLMSMRLENECSGLLAVHSFGIIIGIDGSAPRRRSSQLIFNRPVKYYSLLLSLWPAINNQVGLLFLFITFFFILRKRKKRMAKLFLGNFHF